MPWPIGARIREPFKSDLRRAIGKKRDSFIFNSDLEKMKGSFVAYTIPNRCKGGTGMKEISAGGVVFRHTEQGELQIQLIQDRYGKVSLPKGKMEAGETVEETALREIAEETGLEGVIIAPIDQIKYQYEHATFGTVNKEVHYYLVKAIGGSLQAQVEEIRGVEWFEPLEAWRKQKQSGYENNHRILAGALRLLKVSLE